MKETLSKGENREHFDELLEKILEELPDYVSRMLEEMPVIVDDEPSNEILTRMGLSARPGESDLCGLHSGQPLSERSVMDPGAYPDTVRIFRGPILRTSGDEPGELENQIRITLLHEIGHHFGLEEDELEALGYG